MGEVDLSDNAVATYQTNTKGKKWWWPHFTNCLGILPNGRSMTSVLDWKS